jgi:hypothetical protein
MAQRGEGWPILPVWQADSRAVFGVRLPGGGSLQEKAGMERGARHRTARPANWCSIASNANVKIRIQVAIHATK